jgi:crotonobetainyl-CoA:carnitine CoA-transferase CaiB-like acyl-CoA transferase
MSRRLPLEGIRIADLTQVWAGPKCTQILADLGAEVIKIEAPKRSDPARGTTNLLGKERYPNGDRGARPYNRSAYFNAMNRNKYGITLDLRLEDGRLLFEKLVALSDVVIDNFSAGVMERLGFGYERLRQIKPEIIMVSLSGFGSTGPDSRSVAWAETVEAMAGLPSVTGYQDGPPMLTFQAPSDPVAGMFGAAAVMVALRHRRESGLGQYVDLSQLEALLNVGFAPLLDWELNGRLRERLGNAHPSMAPHGCYPCLGRDAWVAITVTNDDEWTRLCRVLGDHPLASEARFATVLGRIEHRAELDELLADWTRDQEASALAARLQAAGVASGPVLDMGQVASDSQLAERGLLRTIDHSEIGPYPYYYGARARFPGLELEPRKRAPCYGEDNAYVLTHLLGVSKAELERLERDGVIAREPQERIAMPAVAVGQQRG